jgi:hypothetical protein
MVEPQEVDDTSLKRDVIGLIQDVIVYKFPKRPHPESCRDRIDPRTDCPSAEP